MSTSGWMKFYNAKNGWGFVLPEDGGADLYVNYGSVSDQKMPQEGDLVRFDYVWDDKNGRYLGLFQLQVRTLFSNFWVFLF